MIRPSGVKTHFESKKELPEFREEINKAENGNSKTYSIPFDAQKFTRH